MSRKEERVAQKMTNYNELRDGQAFYANGYKAGYKQAILDGKTQYQRPLDEWIPVNERFPDKEGKCLVSTDYGDVCMDSYRDGCFVLNLGNVIAWKPLPEPYKKGGAE